MISSLRNYDKPNSAIFRFDTLSDTDDLSACAKLGYNAALVCEAVRAGFDDVLVIFPDMTEETIDALVFFAKQIDALEPNANVGIAIPYSLIETSENDAYIAEQLWNSFDFLAIDMTLAEEGTELINNNNQIFLYRYTARLLISSEHKEKIPEISKYVNNWQIIDKS